MKCEECHGKISKVTQKCPHCGAETNVGILKGFINPKTYLAAFIIIIIMFIAVSVLVFSEHAPIIIPIIGILALLTYLIVRINMFKKFKETTGLVVDYVVHKSSNYERGDKNFYYAIVEYEYEGETYRKRYPVSFLTYQNGDDYINMQARVFFNPDKPTDSVVKFSKEVKHFFIKDYIVEILLLIMIVLIVLGIIWSLYQIVTG